MRIARSVNNMRRTAAELSLGVLVSVGLLAAGVSFSTVAWAHHSFAGFDKSRKATVQGTVKQWQFTNPHSWLQLVAVEGGRQVEYSIEGASVNTLVRRGWTRTTFKPGDKVIVSIYPSIDGKKGGALLSATFADGKTISTGITPN